MKQSIQEIQQWMFFTIEKTLIVIMKLVIRFDQHAHCYEKVKIGQY